MIQSFEYSALSSSTSFRLIRLETRREDDIAFTISEHQLNKVPAYSALSYRWGSDSKTHKVRLDGKDIGVHANLWHFLRQLRVENDDSFYWTDALCINQEDIPERNQQVAVMAEIYYQAQRVVVWLGSHSHVRYCLELIKQLSQPEALIEDDGDSARLALNNACSDILNLPYWQRAWIVPEITLGKAVMLKSLADELPLESLFSCDLQRAELLKEYPRVGRAQTLLKQVELVNVDGTEFRLESWLYELKYLQCKEPQDKLYSLLGLHQQRNGSHNLTGSLIDYNKSVATVRWDFAFGLLLDVFSCATSVSVERVATLGDWLRLSLMDDLHPGAAANASKNDFSQKVDAERLYDALNTYIVDPLVNRKCRELAEHLHFVSIAHELAYQDQGGIYDGYNRLRFGLSSGLQCLEQAISVLALGIARWRHRYVHPASPDVTSVPRCDTCNMPLENFVIDEDEMQKLDETNVYFGRLGDSCDCDARRGSIVQLLQKVISRGSDRLPLHVMSRRSGVPFVFDTSFQVGQGCVSSQCRGREIIVLWTRHLGSARAVPRSEDARSCRSRKEAGSTTWPDYVWLRAQLDLHPPGGRPEWVVRYIPEGVRAGFEVVPQPPWATD